MNGRATPPSPLASNAYGHFAADGREFVVTDPRTPRPWANVIANERLGLAVSQAGGGFTFVDNSQLAVITRWVQDLAQDNSGKFLYLRDADDGSAWSLSPAPTWPAYDAFTCRHGLGYTTFESEHRGIGAHWTLFADPAETVEHWLVELHNGGDATRRLDLVAFLEWNCGVAPSPRREFHKLFLETRFDAARRAVFASNHMWEVPSKRWGHWNTGFPYVAAFACSAPVKAAEGDKTAFLGRYGSVAAPAALGRAAWPGEFGRHGDAIAALRSRIELAPGERCVLAYTLAVGASADDAAGLLDRCGSPEVATRALSAVRAAWVERLAAHRIQTPDATTDVLINDWVRYQAISARIWGRAGYYQQSGAYGFRDQLQDSQVWLTIEPARTRAQIGLHAAHQFADGSVYHWWHPLSEQGHVTRMSDDLLWLAFVAASYLKETGDLAVLDDPAPFLDEETPAPLAEHVRRAFARSFSRTSPRGLPYIGAGDWNDGLSAVGLEERGESVWLAEFLAGLLRDWAEIWRRTGAPDAAADCLARRERLVAAINEHGWDGEWYRRGTLDDGTPLGSRANRAGRIFLNAQVWAILADIAPPDRRERCWQAVKDHLVSPAGALLLAPAYAEPQEEIGYITRYAPGLRENGGVYTHAATWAIAAACAMRDADTLARLLEAINPARKDPETYWAEPYVLPGNVDGPASPHHGRGGWTWYTGSAAWLHRVVTHHVLGVRPEWDGLRLDPCLPAGWDRARMVRPWRGATYRITIERAASDLGIWLDGARVACCVLPPPSHAGESHEVVVRIR
ncbi:MAG: glycosyl transferase family 36 [Acidobacteria bacterium]|nr:glycosyl transferase family 36 [Acidobacteriota bacterium]